MKRAKLFYGIGSGLMILMGIGHFYGQFGTKGMDIHRSLIEEAMRGYTIKGFGFEYSMMDVMQCWGIFFGLLMMFVGVQNMLILRESSSGLSIKKFALFNVLIVAVLMAIGSIYVPFTAVGFGVILLFFLVSAVLFRKVN